MTRNQVDLTAGLVPRIPLSLPARPVGEIDPRSGRQVTQPTSHPAVNQALATAAMPVYRAGLEDALEGIPGAELAAERAVKNPRRLAEKIYREGQPPETVSDYGAAQISVDSPADRDAVIAAIRKQFPVLREDDDFAQGDPEYGYRNHSLQLQMPNGASQELQIVPREVLEANRAEHRSYKKAREAEIGGKDAGAARARARAINDAAMARFNARNQLPPALEKGQPVALPDGSTGKIVYLDANMKIARVRTGDGRSLTVPQRVLRPADAVLVREHYRRSPTKK